MAVEDNGSIEVTVDTVGTGSEGEINYRFRAVDNESVPVTSSANRGTFSNPEGTKSGITSENKKVIASQYTAPDNSSPCFNDGTEVGQCPQKLQIRVSNLQEIGVSAHFTIYVTDNETLETTTLDNNPVITSISAERVDADKLQFTIEVSDDDPFGSLAVQWDYLGDSKNFSDNSTKNLTYNTGRMSTVMDYADSDDGMLVVTVCEMNDFTESTYPGCKFGDEAATSIQLELIPNAYPEIVVCDEMGCELPNRLVGTRLNPKIWTSCFEDNQENDGHDMRMTFRLTSKDFEFKKEAFESKGSVCNGNLRFVSKLDGRAQQDSGSAFVYPHKVFMTM